MSHTGPKLRGVTRYVARPQSKFPTRPTASKPYIARSDCACTNGTSCVLTVAALQLLKMEALIPAPADCEVRSVIKFLNAQSIAFTITELSSHFPLLVARNWHGAPVVKEIVSPVGAEATDTRTQWFQSQAVDFYDRVYRSWSHGMTNVSFPVANMLKKSWTLAVSVAITISMQLCFVSLHGPREPYFVDEPRS
jgi:hypothetical protein